MLPRKSNPHIKHQTRYHKQECPLATGKKIGEGFDDPRLDTLFLAMPFSWRGSLEQYAGRLHRSYEGKTLVQIYDYVDYQIPKFYRMFRKRQAGYKRLGYEMGELWLGEK